MRRRRSWMLTAAVTGVLAVAGCSDDSGGDGGDSGGTASAAETCAAAEQAMTDLGAGIQTALDSWDGTPESAGEITAVTDRWGQELRDLAAEAGDDELRTLLDDLAAQLDEFGASWAAGGGGASLDSVDAALQPLDDRCGFGAAGELAGDLSATPDACAAALEEAAGGSFEELTTAAADVAQTVHSGGGAPPSLPEAVDRLQQAADRFAGSFRDLAAGADDPRLRAALAGIAAEVETWAASFDGAGEPDDLGGFQAAVTALEAVCD